MAFKPAFLLLAIFFISLLHFLLNALFLSINQGLPRFTLSILFAFIHCPRSNLSRWELPFWQCSWGHSPVYLRSPPRWRILVLEITSSSQLQFKRDLVQTFLFYLLSAYLHSPLSSSACSRCMLDLRTRAFLPFWAETRGLPSAAQCV